MWTHISLICVNRFAVTYCDVIYNVMRNKVKIYWWFWAHKAPFLLLCLIANSSFGSTVCHASEARNVGPCSRMYLYVSTHYHTRSWYHHRVLWMHYRVSHGVPEGWPCGCSPWHPCFFWGVRGVAVRALLTIEANLQWQRLIIVLHIQDNLNCHMWQGTKHSRPTYAYNYNKI